MKINLKGNAEKEPNIINFETFAVQRLRLEEKNNI